MAQKLALSGAQIKEQAHGEAAGGAEVPGPHKSGIAGKNGCQNKAHNYAHGKFDYRFHEEGHAVSHPPKQAAGGDNKANGSVHWL